MPKPSNTATANRAARGISEILGAACWGKQRTVITRYGKPVAAIVSTTDLEALEKLDRLAGASPAQASQLHLDGAPTPEGGR